MLQLNHKRYSEAQKTLQYEHMENMTQKLLSEAPQLEGKFKARRILLDKTQKINKDGQVEDYFEQDFNFNQV